MKQLSFDENREIVKSVDDQAFEYEYITSEQRLKEIIPPFFDKSVLAIDIETTGLGPYSGKIRLVQIGATDLPVMVIDLFKIPREKLQPLEDLLMGRSLKIFQNGKFDLKFLFTNGFIVRKPYFDTMLASMILESGRGGRKGKFKLSSLTERYLGEEISKEQQSSNWDRMNLTSEQIVYGAMDSYILLKLAKKLIEHLKKEKLSEVARLEFSSLLAVVQMELNGIFLDHEKMNNLTDKIKEDLKNAEEKLEKELKPGLEEDMFGGIDINLNSQQQLLYALKKCGLNLKNTSERALKKHINDHPVIKPLLDYRKASKSYTSFSMNVYKPLINTKTGRLHPFYRQTGAASGRLSCSNPNLQQVPRTSDFRGCFTAEPGNKLVVADYSQIELRVAAEIANDKTMIEAYQEGKDLHRLTASLISGKPFNEITKEERQAAKAVNFGLTFGTSCQCSHFKRIISICFPVPSFQTLVR